MSSRTSITVERKAGTLWIKVPLVDGAGSGFTELTISRFTGILFDSSLSGAYILDRIPLDDGNNTGISFKMSISNNVRNDIHLCIGIIEASDVSAFAANGIYRVTCEGFVDEQSLFKYEFNFTLNSSIKLTNVVWSNLGEAPSFIIRDYIFDTWDGMATGYPIVFFFDEANYPNYLDLIRTNAATEATLRERGLPANGYKATRGTGNPIEVTITFNVPTTEFSPVAAMTVMSGTRITLPKPSALANAEGLSWQINGNTYGIGSQFTMPENNVSASLNYEVINYKGVVIV